MSDEVTQEQRREIYRLRATGRGGRLDAIKISRALKAAGHAVSERVVRRVLGLKGPGRHPPANIRYGYEKRTEKTFVRTNSVKLREMFAERDAAYSCAPSPNMLILGDPPPLRSAAFQAKETDKPFEIKIGSRLNRSRDPETLRLFVKMGASR